MPDVSIQIGGQSVINPGVYPQTQVVSTVPLGFVSTGPLIFIANGYGGVPLTPTNYTDSNSLLQAMRGAPSSDFVNFMYDPSTEVNGVSLVTYINAAASNMQSSASILASGSTDVIDLLSANYGTPSNLLQYSIGEGSIGGIQLTLLDGYTGLSASADNLGLPFELAYIGDASTVTYTVASTIGGVATAFNITSSNPGESISIDLTTETYSQVSNVIEYLNGTGYYAAIGISNGALTTSSLDLVSNINLPKPVSNVNQYINVTATLGDIVFWVNTYASTFATATLHMGIISNTGYIPVVTPIQFFSGGTNVPANLANYADALNVALTIPGWTVFIDQSAGSLPGITALGAQHVATASSVQYRLWRRYVTGSQIGETASTAQTNARNLNQINCTYCWPGIQATSTITGNNQFYDGLHVAAAAAGMMTGNPVAMPLTAKTLNGNGVEQTADLATKIALQGNGVLVLDYPPDTKIPTFLSDVTTWQNDASAANVFNQQVACRYALSYYLKQALQPYIGTIAATFSLTNANNAVIRTLNQLIYNGTNASGILNSWDPTSLVLNYTGSSQTLTVTVSVVLVGQIRFIPITVSIQPLNVNITSAGTTVTTS